ncbi:glutathione peroxidase [Hyphomonas sp.]|uniref:glutathione peroxidase n=1 Tax=Hyphomonas sp. TaxID=87 RepID=UPI0035613D59
MRSLIGIGLSIMLIACHNQAADSSATAQVSELVSQRGDMMKSSDSIYNVEFISIAGEPMPFSEYSGQVVLVVNTASRCGYTPQYEGLQELHSTFADREFTLLGVPSNDFGGQEPGSESEIATFCKINYGVEFPLTQKVHAIGSEQHAFWQAARKELGEKAEPKWNFHKILVSRDGQFIQAYPSGVRPADSELIADIEAALG